MEKQSSSPLVHNGTKLYTNEDGDVIAWNDFSSAALSTDDSSSPPTNLSVIEDVTASNSSSSATVTASPSPENLKGLDDGVDRNSAPLNTVSGENQDLVRRDNGSDRVSVKGSSSLKNVVNQDLGDNGGRNLGGEGHVDECDDLDVDDELIPREMSNKVKTGRLKKFRSRHGCMYGKHLFGRRFRD